MKIKSEYKLRKIGGTNIVVSTAGMDFQGIITINDTAEFIWKKLENGAEENEIISSLAAECNVEEKDIENDVKEFISTLKGAGIVE